MNKLISMILCIAFLSLLAACGGGSNGTSPAPSAAKGVAFSFSKDSAKTSGKTVNASVPTTIDPTARYASITATDASGNTVLADYKTDIYSLNGSYITATVPLTPGAYIVTKFLVLDSNYNVLYLAPTQFASDDIKRLVSPVLPVDFTVTNDETRTITLQVLSPDNSPPIDFGYPSITFSVVNYAKLMSCVQILDRTSQNWQLTGANLTVNGISYNHPALTSALRVAQAESYTLVFSKATYETITIMLTSTDIVKYQTTPLVVRLTPAAVPIQHSVYFNGNGGTPVPPPQTVADGGVVTVPVPDPTQPGFTFGGWYSDLALPTPFDFSTRLTGDLTLYAKWTAIAPTHSQTWAAAGTYTFEIPAGVNVLTLSVVGADGGEGGIVVADSTGDGGEGGGFSRVSSENTRLIEARGGNGADGEQGDDSPISGQPGKGENYSILTSGNRFIGPYSPNTLTLIVGKGGAPGSDGHYGGASSGAFGADGHITINW
jgi:uncharacterized repeat protein (TIGR02543 family)